MPSVSPIAPLSAAVMLSDWVQRMGRFPTDQECVASHALPHWVSLYKMFPGSSFSARISAALALPGAFTSHMTALSAATMIGAWVEREGRFPAHAECVASQGLPHWVGVCTLFPASSFRASISAALALPGALAANVKLRDCLGTDCTVRFLTTPETRLCPRCRHAAAQRSHEYDEPLLRRASLRQWGIGLADWDMELMGG